MGDVSGQPKAFSSITARSRTLLKGTSYLIQLWESEGYIPFKHTGSNPQAEQQLDDPHFVFMHVSDVLLRS